MAEIERLHKEEREIAEIHRAAAQGDEAAARAMYERMNAESRRIQANAAMKAAGARPVPETPEDKRAAILMTEAQKAEVEAAGDAAVAAAQANIQKNIPVGFDPSGKKRAAGADRKELTKAQLDNIRSEAKAKKRKEQLQAVQKKKQLQADAQQTSDEPPPP